MLFGQQLEHLRTSRKRSKRWVVQRAEQIAPDVAGITRSALRQWETEKDGRLPNLAQLHVLSLVLDLSLVEQVELLRASRGRVAERARQLASSSLEDAPSAA